MVGAGKAANTRMASVSLSPQGYAAEADGRGSGGSLVFVRSCEPGFNGTPQERVASTTLTLLGPSTKDTTASEVYVGDDSPGGNGSDREGKPGPVGRAPRSSTVSSGTDRVAHEEHDTLGSLPKLPGSALNRHHLGEVDNSSKSVRHRLTATVRNLIHEFLPSGAGDSQAERYAIARGWLSQGEHQKDDMELEAQRLMMVLWSVQRVENFEEFRPPVSHQFFAVCVFPLVALFFALLVFAAPFADVEDGREANWVHFMALGLGASLVFQVPVALILSLTRIPMSWSSAVLSTIPGGILTSALAWGVSEIFGYPFVFVPITCGFPGFLLTVYITFRLMPTQLRKLHRVRIQMVTAVVVSVLTLMVMGCWAVHRLGFVMLADNGLWQSVFTLLLPIMKMTFRWLFGKVALRADPDMGPSLVFVVEYFNSIFVATLMTDTTVASGILLVTYDLIGNLCLLIPLWRGQSFLYLVRTEGAAMRDEVLHQCWCCPSRETAIQVRHRIAERRRRKRSAQAHTSRPMVVAVHTPSQRTNDSGTDGSGKSTVELASQRPSSIPAVAPSLGVGAPRPESKQCWNSSTRPGGTGPGDGGGTSATDRPAGGVPPARPRSLSPDCDITTRIQHKQSMANARKELLLHRWRLRQVEMIILAEFVEVFTPFQYFIFMLYAYYGWNRNSFIGFHTMSETDFLFALKWVGLLTFVELCGFIVLCLAMWKVQKISPLRQLAFVIRENSWLMGSSVCLMFVYTIALIVRQNGCDLLYHDSQS